jgi:hypothetical protein
MDSKRAAANALRNISNTTLNSNPSGHGVRRKRVTVAAHGCWVKLKKAWTGSFNYATREPHAEKRPRRGEVIDWAASSKSAEKK